MPLPNMHPADELAMIREDQRRLAQREAELQQGFLTLALDKTGAWATVSVRLNKQRRLIADRLPPEVLANDGYWDTLVRREVHVDCVAQAMDQLHPSQMATPAGTTDFDVLERF